MIKLIANCFICKDSKRSIIQACSKSIRDCPASVAETLMIREAIKEIGRMHLENIVVESDSEVTILSITGKIDVPKLISNLVENIINMSKRITSIKFFYYNKSANILTDSEEEMTTYIHILYIGLSMERFKPTICLASSTYNKSSG